MKYYGIDQTGAILSKDKPKPLKACEVIFREGSIFDLKFFTIEHLGHWISSLNPDHKNHIFIDCVLGLPVELYKSNNKSQIRDWISLAKNYSHEHKSYGMAVAESFFNHIKNFYNIKEDNHPKRSTEIKLKSNSVFTTRPFQKNIQTGTFRIWKELSFVLDSVLIWPLDYYLENELKTVVYEVYPSHFYKKIFGLKNRSHLPLLDVLENVRNINKTFDFDEHVKFLNDPDFCDALIAAFGGYLTIHQRNVWNSISDQSFFEGEILE